MAEKMPDWRKIKPDDPKRLALLARAGYALDLMRKTAAKEVEAMEAEVREIKNLLIQDFPKADLKEISTPYGTARLVTKTVPVMDPDAGGWEAIQKYIVKTGFWQILQKRLGEKACQELWDDKKKIPGVKQFHRADIKFGDAE